MTDINKQIDLLTKRCDAMEAEIKTTKAAMAKVVTAIRDLPNLIESHIDQVKATTQTVASTQDKDAESALYERYNEGLKRNSKVRLNPEIIAIYSHYSHLKRLTATAIHECGLTTLGQSRALGRWDIVFARDYCQVHGVLDTFNNASTNKELAEKYEAVRNLNKLLQETN